MEWRARVIDLFMGSCIVSNGLACLVLLVFELRGSWNGWGGVGWGFMWFSTLIAEIARVITVGLAASLFKALQQGSDPNLAQETSRGENVVQCAADRVAST